MNKSRLEAFSDGVLAIIITIMVLEMKVPHGASLDSLSPVLPIFMSYVLSLVSTGTIIIICCTRPAALRALCFGQTCICFSGSPSSHLPLGGWARIILQRCHLHFTA